MQCHVSDTYKNNEVSLIYTAHSSRSSALFPPEERLYCWTSHGGIKVSQASHQFM